MFDVVVPARYEFSESYMRLAKMTQKEFERATNVLVGLHEEAGHAEGSPETSILLEDS